MINFKLSWQKIWTEWNDPRGQFFETKSKHPWRKIWTGSDAILEAILEKLISNINSKLSLQKNWETECRKSEGSQDVLRAIWENLGGSKSCQGANSATLKSKLLFQVKVKVILKEMNGKLSGKVDGNRICLWQFRHLGKVISWISVPRVWIWWNLFGLVREDQSLSWVDGNANDDDDISKEISAPLWKEEVLNTWQLVCNPSSPCA